jgi:phenylacetate-coenzyme A ligase PaaK-like adenylate-forming protein
MANILFPHLEMPLPLVMRDRLTALVAYAKSQRRLNNVLRYHPLYYSKTQRVIARMALSGPEARRALQSELLAKILRTAQRTPYGRAYSLNLHDWPILDKEQVRADPGRFLAPVLWPVPAATSGSSGVPLRLERGLSNIASEQAFLDSLLAPYGLSFKTARIAVLRGDNVKSPVDMTPPFGRYRDPGYLILSFPHLNPETLDWFADELERFRPDILWIYPTGGSFLASLLQEHQRHLRIPVILSSSEVLEWQARALMQHTFGSVVLDYYGQAERVCFSWQDEAHTAWFHPAYGLVELDPLPAEDSTAVREARVIATGFWNKRMPLVRYDTGDRIAYPAAYTARDLADVALGLKPFLQVMGRRTEYLVTPEGGRVLGLNNIPREVAHLLRVQFIQERANHVEIRVQPTPGYTPEDAAHLMRNARTKIPDSISIAIVSDLPLRTTAQMKTPFVIRTLD